MGLGRTSNRRNRWPSAIWLLVLMLIALPMSGCGGCSDDPAEQQAAKDAAEKKKKEEEAKKKKEEEKKKADFDVGQPMIVPFRAENPSRGVKPGHWQAVSQAMKTNNFDFIGEVDCELLLKTSDGREVLPPARIATSRPATLPKGQQRYLEIPFFVPPTEPARPWIITDLKSRGGGSVIQSSGTPLEVMPPYQFYFFVLAREPIRYRQSLDRLDAIRGPIIDGRFVYYKLIVPPLEKQIALPAHPLAWTSIAYVLWDDVDPTALSPDQQKAMLDWLHWGGQLILSGPGTIATLRGSFLAPYLPAEDSGTRDITADNLSMLSDMFTPKEGKRQRPLKPAKPWSGIKFAKAADAEFVPKTGELVVERNVGRGRIVATSFKLSTRAIQEWPGFDTFFNACLMRHPAREFISSNDSLEASRFRWLGNAEHTFDARLTSTVRYLSRDLAADGTFAEIHTQISYPDSSDSSLQPPGSRVGRVWRADSIPLEGLESEQSYGAGVCGWSDTSAVSAAASESLGAAAGIDIPRAGFVAWMLGAYLVVLVPLNWAIFRTVRRVEWAWIAVPVIAMAGAVVVTKAAKLNIGFARSQTEIGLLELHNGYSRGHLTRYTALYTSLSTSYEVKFDDPYAVVQPFELPGRTRSPTWEPSTYTLRQGADVRLGGFGVSSNSTSMLHSEQMYDLGGTIAYADNNGPPTVFNRTRFTFPQAAVVRKTSPDELQVAWLGQFAPGQVGRPLDFETFNANGAVLPRWRNDPMPDSTIPPLSLAKLAQLVTDRNGLKPGEVRLVASLSEPLPGMEVDPAASQVTRSAVLVVAHLRFGPRAEPQPDRGVRDDDPAELREEFQQADKTNSSN
jgi:hypothetical protein